MRLVNATTLSLESFHGGDIPLYAILSHTWEDGEVTFQEFTGADGTQSAKVTIKAGYGKIAATCKQALTDGYRYVWVDTCCIDKTSSAELTEVINSMFSWYRRSEVCYAYLSDFTLDKANIPSKQDENWEDIGERGVLTRLISDITGVPEPVLFERPKLSIQTLPIAVRISWIAKRQTTRIEDMSYSLLGILDVNMPMLYGEGPKAFTRLQEEIIRKYNDLSIFAWTGYATALGFMPMLAASPANFDSNPATTHSRESSRKLGTKLSTQFSLTNQGVFFPNARLQYQRAVPPYRHHYLLVLNYRDPDFRGRGRRWYLLLQKIGPGIFIRIHDSPTRLRTFQKQRITAPFYEPACILNNPSQALVRQVAQWERYAVRIRWRAWDKFGRMFWHIRTAQPRANWDLAENQFLLEMASERYMHIEFIPGNHRSNPNFSYFVLIIEAGDNKQGARNPAIVSARIVSAEVWQRINVTEFGFRPKEALALEAFKALEFTERSGRISLVGYNISVSVELVEKPNEVPYHHVYLNWTDTAQQPPTDQADGGPSPLSPTNLNKIGEATSNNGCVDVSPDTM